MISQKNLELLKENLQLNIYELRIWTSLLSRGISSAAELADISNVPRSRCYDVLETLEKKGFIVMKIGKPIRYIAIHPEEVIDRVAKGYREETARVLNATDELKDEDSFRELELLYKSGIKHIEPMQLATSIVGRLSILAEIKAMIEKAESKAIISLLDKQNKKMLNAVLNSIRKKGKRLKVVLCSNNKKSLEQFKGVASVSEFGYPLSFIIIDSKEMLFYTSDNFTNPQKETAVWVDAPFFVKAIETVICRNIKP